MTQEELKNFIDLLVLSMDEAQASMLQSKSEGDRRAAGEAAAITLTLKIILGSLSGYVKEQA